MLNKRLWPIWPSVAGTISCNTPEDGGAVATDTSMLVNLGLGLLPVL